MKRVNLSALQPICLVATARSGSDFLQSLLDGHPEVLLFNLNFRFLTEYLPATKTWNGSSTNLTDFIDEFIGTNIERLVTIYQKDESQDKLGKNKNQSLRIDTLVFKQNFLDLVAATDVSEASVLLGIYGAYNLCLNKNLSKMKVFFHHAHNIYEAKRFKDIFPNTKLITTIRDPRSAMVSVNKIATNPKFVEWDNYRNFYLSLCMPIFEDKASNSFFNQNLHQEIPFGPMQNKLLIESIDENSLLVRLEDIPREEHLRELSQFLNIKYLPSMTTSTWGGLEWWGDSFSSKKLSPNGWTENKTDNGWRNELSKSDLFLLNNILYDVFLKRGYEVKEITFWTLFMSFFLSFIPMSYELRYLNPVRITKKFIFGRLREKIHSISFPYYYFKVRVMLIVFIHAQVTGIWRSWPGIVLGKKK